MQPFLILIAGGMLACTGTGAGAQVFKCPGPDGKVTYRDAPCTAGSPAGEMDQRTLRANTVNGMPKPPAQPARPAPAPPPEPAIAVRQAYCPPGDQARGLSVSAGSVTIGQREREFLQAEVWRLKECSKGEGSYTPQDWESIMTAHKSQSRIDPRDRKRTRDIAEAIHASKGSPAVMAHVEAAIQRRNALRARSAPQATGGMASCDADGCWDTSGRRYNRAAGSDNLFRQDGKACRTVANTIQCD